MLMYESSETKSSPKQTLRAVLENMTEFEQAALLDSVEHLQETLHRFILLLNSESVEITTRAMAAVQKIGDEIRKALAMHHAQNSKEQLERWENEGGHYAVVVSIR